MTYKIKLYFTILTDKDTMLKKEQICEKYYFENNFLVLENEFRNKIYIHTSEIDYFTVTKVKKND